MAKTLNGGALISYGANLPSPETTPDGALFYKTDALDSTPSGLYMFGFIRDADTGTFGFQTSQVWQQVVASDFFLRKSGDTMTGVLTVPNYIKIAGPGSQRLIINSTDSAGNNKPSILSSQNGILSIVTGTSNNSDGGALSGGLSIDTANPNTGLQWFGQQVWTSQNDGAGSTLDADLLDGEQGSFYRSASNINAGVLPVTVGGTGANTPPIIGGVAFGSSTSRISFTPQGTNGWLFQSTGANTPTWVNPSTLTVGNATTANTANSATTANTANSATTADTATLAATATLATKASTVVSSGNAPGRLLTFDPAGINTNVGFLWGTNNGTNNEVYSTSTITVGGANKLSTPRTIAFQGGVQGTAQFDGTKDIVINTVLNTAASNTVFPTGMLAFFSGFNAPPGWLVADGTVLNRTTYAALWAWGQGNGPVSEVDWFNNGYFGRYSIGDTVSNFRIPDLRGLFLRSWDNGRGMDVNRELGKYQAPVVGYHDHPTYDPTHVHGIPDQIHTHGATTSVNGFHGHGVTDPGHAHTNGAGAGGGVNYASQGPNPTFIASNTGASATNISINGDGNHQHDITVNGAYSNINVTNPAGVGVVVGAAGIADGRPSNMSYILCIKY